MGIVDKLKYYDQDFKALDVLSEIIAGLAYFDNQIEYNSLQAESEYAVVSKELRESYLHKAEIARMSKARLVERFFKETSKLNEDAQERFIQRLHDTQSYDTEGDARASQDNELKD